MDYRFAMVCLTNHTSVKKEKLTVHDYFDLPIIKKLEEEEKEASDINTLALMFNQGLKNPLTNEKSFKRAKEKGLIDEDSVNKFIAEKWNKK